MPPATGPTMVAACQADEFQVTALAKSSVGTRLTTSEDEEGTASAEQDGVPVNLLVAKQRNGPTGDVNLVFLKGYTRFEGVSKVSAEDYQVSAEG